MLGVLGALEQSQSPLRAVDRVLRVDPQDLGGLRTGLVELPQLREIGGQPAVTFPDVWGPGRAFAQRRQRLRILLQHIACEPQLAGCQWPVKRIGSHACLDNLDSSRRVSGPKKRRTKCRIREIGIQGNGLLELGYRLLMLAEETQHQSEAGM